MKGVARLVKSKTRLVRYLWLISVLFGGGFATYQLATLFMAYYSYQVNVQVHDLNEEPAFPDVTICNLNPLYEATTDYLSFSEYLSVLYELNDRFYASDGAEKIPRDHYAEAYAHMSSITGYFENLYMPDLSNTSTEILKDFIISCKFYSWEWIIIEDIDCITDSAKLYWDPNYSYCATLSLNKLPDLSTRVRGLTVILYLSDVSSMVAPTYSHDFLHSKSSGALVSINPPSSVPNLKNSIMVSPGYETTIHVKVTERELKPAPYGNCKPMEYFDISGESLNAAVRYSQSDCISLCRQRQILKQCNCLSSNYLTTNDNLKNYVFCGNFSALKLARFLYKYADVIVDTGLNYDKLYMMALSSANYEYMHSGSATFWTDYNGDDDDDNDDVRGSGTGSDYHDQPDYLTVDARRNDSSFHHEQEAQDIPNYETMTEVHDSSSDTSGNYLDMLSSSNTTMETFLQAVKNFICLSTSNKTGGGSCDCPTPCKNFEYTFSISQVPWPNLAYQPAFYCTFIATNPRIHQHFRSYEEITFCSEQGADVLQHYDYYDSIRNNFLQLNVMFPSAKKTVLKDKASSSWETLFSNIGGTLNLWIGVTFITLIEICELLSDILNDIRCRGQQNRRKVSSETRVAWTVNSNDYSL